MRDGGYGSVQSVGGRSLQLSRFTLPRPTCWRPYRTAGAGEGAPVAPAPGGGHAGVSRLVTEPCLAWANPTARAGTPPRWLNATPTTLRGGGGPGRSPVSAAGRGRLGSM